MEPFAEHQHPHIRIIDLFCEITSCHIDVLGRRWDVFPDQEVVEIQPGYDWWTIDVRLSAIYQLGQGWDASCHGIVPDRLRAGGRDDYRSR